MKPATARKILALERFVRSSGDWALKIVWAEDWRNFIEWGWSEDGPASWMLGFYIAAICTGLVLGGMSYAQTADPTLTRMDHVMYFAVPIVTALAFRLAAVSIMLTTKGLKAGKKSIAAFHDHLERLALQSDEAPIGALSDVDPGHGHLTLVKQQKRMDITPPPPSDTWGTP